MEDLHTLAKPPPPHQPNDDPSGDLLPHPPIIRPAEAWQTHVHQIFAQFDTRAPIDQERRDQFSVNS